MYYIQYNKVLSLPSLPRGLDTLKTCSPAPLLHPIDSTPSFKSFSYPRPPRRRPHVQPAAGPNDRRRLAAPAHPAQPPLQTPWAHVAVAAPLEAVPTGRAGHVRAAFHFHQRGLAFRARAHIDAFRHRHGAGFGTRLSERFVVPFALAVVADFSFTATCRDEGVCRDKRVVQCGKQLEMQDVLLRKVVVPHVGQQIGDARRRRRRRWRRWF